MLSKLKNLPTTPLVIGIVVTMTGCILMFGIIYALAVPRSGGAAENNVTPTRRYFTATPIASRTPTATIIPTDRPTDQPTSVPPTNTNPAPVVNQPQATRVPSTAVPPTNTSVPPTPVLGADIGLDKIGFNLSLTTQGRKLDIPFFIKVHNANAWQLPFGYLGVAVQDQNGVSVAFRKMKINSYFQPDELYSAHDSIKVNQAGEMKAYFVICLSANDDLCDQPGADYRQLAGPISLTITE